MEPIAELIDIGKRYKDRNDSLKVLDGVSLAVNKYDFIAITGPSGSGKSTLMNIMGCLDIPDSGKYSICGKDTAKMTGKELSGYRKNCIGFVFQSFLLLPRYTAKENVELPMRYKGLSKKERSERAENLLETMGLKDRMHHYPNELSGGQCQRTAIARALANEPKLILADEPTGNLDPYSGGEIMDIFLKLNEKGTSIVLITHDMNIAKKSKTSYLIENGRLVKGD